MRAFRQEPAGRYPWLPIDVSAGPAQNRPVSDAGRMPAICPRSDDRTGDGIYRRLIPPPARQAIREGAMPTTRSDGTIILARRGPTRRTGAGLALIVAGLALLLRAEHRTLDTSSTAKRSA